MSGRRARAWRLQRCAWCDLWSNYRAECREFTKCVSERHLLRLCWNKRHCACAGVLPTNYISFPSFFITRYLSRLVSEESLQRLASGCTFSSRRKTSAETRCGGREQGIKKTSEQQRLFTVLVNYNYVLVNYNLVIMGFRLNVL